MRFERQAALVSRLFEATSRGRLAWQVSPSRPNAFEVAFPNYAVILGHGVEEVFVELVNQHGEAADVFDDVELDHEGPDGAPVDGSWPKTMRETYRLARRAALGADKALDDVLTALQA
jgi:hypothetical protein